MYELNLITSASDSGVELNVQVETASPEVEVVLNSGVPGEDGFSPVINVTPISGGHAVEITDANGTKTFNVMDGVNGSGGGGSGDMLMSVYDTDGNGVVDNAEKLDGKTADYFAKAQHEHEEYLTEYTETDPTVPAWAKAESKPTYTAEEIGLGNVDNVRQYSASNPPPYPVTSVNGQTGDVVVEGVDGVTPVRGVDYWTEADIATIKGYVDDAILGGSW